MRTPHQRFLSTLSLRRATGSPPPCARPTRDFYPHSPCGERHNTHTYRVYCPSFLSTLSLRRATARRASRQQPAGISIHTLLAESDNANLRRHRSNDNFYPHSPCGERLTTLHDILKLFTISIHTLLAESDDNGRMRDAENLMISIHTLLAESDVEEVSGDTWARDFYPHSPCGERRKSNKLAG